MDAATDPMTRFDADLKMTTDTTPPMSADRIDLVAIDLDDTLLRSDGSVSQANAQAIGKAVAQGVKVVLATARPPRGCRKVMAQLKLDTLVINHNGALVYDFVRDKPVRHYYLHGQLVRQVIELAYRIDPKLSVGVEIMDQLFVAKGANPLVSEPSMATAQQGVGALDQVLDRDITKVVVLGSSDSLGELHMELRRAGKGTVSTAFTHNRLLSVVHAQANKGNALTMVAERYKISKPNIMAVGDAPNDLDMYHHAGLNVAVGNAWDDVKRHAHFTVAACNLDGVAEAINRFVLVR